MNIVYRLAIAALFGPIRTFALWAERALYLED